MDSDTLNKLEARLWDAANVLWAGASLKPAEYSPLVLGLIFLKFADHRFTVAEAEIEKKATGRREVGKTDYQARGVLYLPKQSRFSSLIQLPENENIGKALNEAMKAIETDNPELKDVLPKSFNILDNRILMSLLKTFNSIPMDVEGDVFGKIYEYFLGKFAMSEGQKGGEFFTPTSDILTKLEMNLTEKERSEVKKVSRKLLERLKKERLVLDWRKRQQSRAAVRLCVEEELDGLPRTYSKDIWKIKCKNVFQHVFDNYQDYSHSVYAMTG